MRLLTVQVQWKQRSLVDVAETLSKLGHEVKEYPVMLTAPSYLSDETVAEIVAYVKENQIQIMISCLFAMNLALAAYQSEIRYIVMLWDAPFLQNYNPLGKIDNVWFTTFDRLDRERFLQYGMPHVLYQPLAVNKEAVIKWKREIQKTLRYQYIHDICFLGRLYGNNLYADNLPYIPMEIQQYFTSIFEEASFRWDGINRIYGKTGPEMIELLRRISPQFSMTNLQDVSDERYFESFGLIREIAHIERIAVLNLLAENHSVILYTTDYKEAKEKLQGVEIGPPVEYGKATALVYAGSKINLNISLKGIEGGTPLRIMDIMGVGGFVLSSYCEETADLFEEDKEIVMFRTPEELVEKVDYYLTHDKERERIAEAGFEKVIKCYTYEKKLQELLAWVTGDVS